MTHPDLETLLRAVGAPDEGTRQHLVACPRCRSDMATMTRARSAGAALAAEPGLGAMVAPPSQVWTAIAREAAGPEASRGTVSPLPARSSRVPLLVRRALVAATVAASFLLGMLVTSLAGDDNGRRSASVPPRTTVLAPVGDHVSSGTLALSDTASHRSLTVSLKTSDPGRGFLEVWLLDGRSGGMVALGVLDGRRGSYDVPTGLDMAAYDQVDVSREPFDGDPAHAKQSLARGRLP
jgi:hypothetical protein